MSAGPPKGQKAELSLKRPGEEPGSGWLRPGGLRPGIPGHLVSTKSVADIPSANSAVYLVATLVAEVAEQVPGKPSGKSCPSQDECGTVRTVAKNGRRSSQSELGGGEYFNGGFGTVVEPFLEGPRWGPIYLSNLTTYTLPLGSPRGYRMH